MKYVFLFLFQIFFSLSFCQSTFPENGLRERSTEIHAFTNCTLVTQPGQLIEKGVLLIREGKIEAVGKNISVPPEALIHDLKGAWVYPGFIDPWSDYGQPKQDEDKEKGSRSPIYETAKKGPYAWNEAVKPEINASEIISHDPKSAKELRKSGFTLVNSVPTDGIFRGTACLVFLDDQNLRKSLLKPNSTACFSFSKGRSRQSYPSSLMGSIALIRQTFLDLNWYKSARDKMVDKTEVNLSLEALLTQLNSNLPLIFETTDHLDIFRANQIAKEYGLQFFYKTNGDEYKRLKAIGETGASLIIPLTFPKNPDLNLLADAREVPLSTLREWEQAPQNPAKLAETKIPFAFTIAGLKKAKLDFDKMLRKALDHGLQPEAALEALTLAPARILGIEKLVGSLEKGKIASFFICEGDYFGEEKPQMIEVWAQGKQHLINPLPEMDIRGRYKLTVESRITTLLIGGKLSNFEAKWVILNDSTDKMDTLKSDLSLEGLQLNLFLKSKKKDITLQLTGLWRDQSFEGQYQDNTGKRGRFIAKRDGDWEEKEKKKPEKKPDLSTISPVTFPNMAFGRITEPASGPFLIKNITIWTNTENGKQKGQDVLIEDGKISQIGTGLSLPADGILIDGTDLHLTPGIIDEHSHIAISRGVNEGSHAITAEVRIGDVIDSDDINIYRQLSGGVTTSHLLHGSANPIGGQTALIKMRWGSTPEEMKFEAADGFIKFALGENVKQSNWGDEFTIRYPQTRMGVEQIMRDGFQAALEYRQTWKTWSERSGNNPPLIQPRKNLQMETLLEILDSKRFITCHSYVQSEITMLMRLAESFGFRVNTFTHVLEGYKISDKIKAHGASASTFSDWWAYKYEVIDALPYNAAMMAEKGINVCINSDDAEMGRRLNQEAAKAVKYGGISEEEALKMVTLNPAKTLHIDHRVGSIEKGKDADLVIWSDNPLSVYAVAQKTFVDGKLCFDRGKQGEIEKAIQIERNRIIQKIQNDPGEKEKGPPKGKDEKHYHCDTFESDYN